MKPRFSILTLLGITAYAAVQAASAAQPDSIWPAVGFYLHAAYMFLFAVIACGRTSPITILARAMLVGEFLWTYLEGTEFLYMSFSDFAVFNWWLDFNGNTRHSTDLLVDRLNGLGLGLALGGIALWRYRVLERREKREL